MGNECDEKASKKKLLTPLPFVGLLLCGAQVIGSGLTPQHVSLHGPSSLPSIVADWLLLSSCQLYVLTESAFAKTAVAFNLSPFFHVLFHVRGDQDGFKWRASCDGAKSSSLLEFSQLSGL